MTNHSGFYLPPTDDITIIALYYAILQYKAPKHRSANISPTAWDEVKNRSSITTDKATAGSADTGLQLLTSLHIAYQNHSIKKSSLLTYLLTYLLESQYKGEASQAYRWSTGHPTFSTGARKADMPTITNTRMPVTLCSLQTSKFPHLHAATATTASFRVLCPTADILSACPR